MAVTRQLVFQNATDAVWLLQARVLAAKELDALILELIVHHALVVACNSDTPLLKLSDDALAALLGDPGYVTLSARVLK